MIQYRKIRSVRLSKMKMNIVIFISAVDLFPNACFYLLLLIFTNQVVKTLIGEPEEFIHALISGHRKKFMVCIKKFVIFLVCSVYDKCTRKVFGDMLPDKNALWLVYCRTGRRSADAVQKLESLGYTDLRDLGGILSWPYEIEGDFEGHF